MTLTTSISAPKLLIHNIITIEKKLLDIPMHFCFRTVHRLTILIFSNEWQTKPAYKAFDGQLLIIILLGCISPVICREMAFDNLL